MEQRSSSKTHRNIHLMIALAGTVGFMSLAQTAQARPSTQGAKKTLSIQGVLRNFRATHVAHGHTDFGSYDNDASNNATNNAGATNASSMGSDASDDQTVGDDSGSDSDGDGNTDSSDSEGAKIAHVRHAHSMGNIATTLDSNGKPVYIGSGQLVQAEWRAPAGREIHPSIFDVTLGDFPGSFGSPDDAGISSARSYRQWYRDVPGKNVSSLFNMTLQEHPSGNGWIFTDNSGGDDAQGFNFRGNLDDDFADDDSSDGEDGDYTIELSLQFQYLANANQFITIGGMDDVYVFINNELAIDLGGVDHGVHQTVLLDRLNLNDGDVLNLNIFMAERTGETQDFILETSFDLWNGQTPTTMAMYD